MSLKILVPASWALWSLFVVLCLIGLGRVLTERTHNPEATRGLGVMVIGLILVVMFGLGLWLFLAARSQSLPQVIAVALILAVPGTLLVAMPAVAAFKKWRFDAAEGRIGDFPEPGAQACALAITANDAAALRAAIGAASVPAGRDRAGHDLLAYAVRRIAEGKAGIEVLRVLLEQGADPKTSRLPDGQPLVHTLVLGRYWAKDATPAGIALLLAHGADPNELDPTSGDAPLRRVGDQPDVVRLLVEHGADINQLDSYGQPAVVHFTGTREWESAIFLVERGARLDIVSASGVSIDYYLASWQNDVFGEHPEGWDRLRAAIAQRRSEAPR